MLTNDDFVKIKKLIQETVQPIVREEVGNEIQTAKNEIQADITLSRMKVQNDIDELKNRIKNLEIRLTKVHTDLKEEIKMVSHFLDKDNMKTLKRVEKIEEHLQLPSST
jgi:division protein CdvB (Snf7/Vps24/ESCRT-III family)